LGQVIIRCYGLTSFEFDRGQLKISFNFEMGELVSKLFDGGDWLWKNKHCLT